MPQLRSKPKPKPKPKSKAPSQPVTSAPAQPQTPTPQATAAPSRPTYTPPSTPSTPQSKYGPRRAPRRRTADAPLGRGRRGRRLPRSGTGRSRDLTSTGGVLEYSADSGRRNVVAFEETAPGTVRVVRQLSAGGDEDAFTTVQGCTAIGVAVSYSCPGITRVVANGGDGDDRLDAGSVIPAAAWRRSPRPCAAARAPTRSAPVTRPTCSRAATATTR